MCVVRVCVILFPVSVCVRAYVCSLCVCVRACVCVVRVCVCVLCVRACMRVWCVRVCNHFVLKVEHFPLSITNSGANAWLRRSQDHHNLCRISSMYMGMCACYRL